MGRFQLSTGKPSTHWLRSLIDAKQEVAFLNGELIRPGLVFIALCFWLGMLLGGPFAGETIGAP
jgi:hypothetical protein